MQSYLSENLKYLRNVNQVSQAQLANALSVSVKSISHWETGYTEPSIAQLIQLAEFYDVSIDELVGRSRDCR